MNGHFSAAEPSDAASKVKRNAREVKARIGKIPVAIDLDREFTYCARIFRARRRIPCRIHRRRSTWRVGWAKARATRPVPPTSAERAPCPRDQIDVWRVGI